MIVRLIRMPSGKRDIKELDLKSAAQPRDLASTYTEAPTTSTYR